MHESFWMSRVWTACWSFAVIIQIGVIGCPFCLLLHPRWTMVSSLCNYIVLCFTTLYLYLLCYFTRLLVLSRWYILLQYMPNTCIHAYVCKRTNVTSSILPKPSYYCLFSLHDAAFLLNTAHAAVLCETVQRKSDASYSCWLSYSCPHTYSSYKVILLPDHNLYCIWVPNFGSFPSGKICFNVDRMWNSLQSSLFHAP